MNHPWLAFSVLIPALVLSCIAVVSSKHASRELFAENQMLVRERDRLNVEWGMLQLEQGAWATHGRVEQLAAEQLEMRIPRRGDVVILKQGRSEER